MFKKIIFKIVDLFGYSIQKKDYLPPLYWSNKTENQLRILFHYDMFKKTELLEGNIVEVGVASGDTIAFLNNLCLQFGINKKSMGLIHLRVSVRQVKRMVIILRSTIPDIGGLIQNFLKK